jgi:hypothetical protein
MQIPDHWQQRLDALARYPDDEVAELLHRLMRATNPIAGDVDLVDHVLGTAIRILEARRRARSWNGHRAELELTELPAP